MLKELVIRGLVQGVGFRPFIYLLAQRFGLKGTVTNRNNGVVIRAYFPSVDECAAFVEAIQDEAPPVAQIHSIEVHEVLSNEKYTGFTIIASESQSDEVTQVAPDIAVCTDCLHDRETQAHRIGYPFINCTHCGPRFTIIKDLPYDRVRTTMSVFEMCPDCRKEYTEINDRRFHAQPVACNQCGPIYYADYKGERITEYQHLLELTSRLLNEGKVIAAKGIGGYHLVCDANNEDAVARLREIKHRDSKPFAVMFKDVDSTALFTYLNNREREVLESWRRPIVLLTQRKALAPELNKGMKTIGCMLPYMPIHYDWFERVNTPVLVVTSGNTSDMPIAISPEEIKEQFLGKVDFILHHNRTIHNRADDSVLQACGNQTCLIRRSRGYVPEPFFADMDAEGILAFGAEKVNTFALGKGDTIIQSQYIGDLKNWETFAFYTESLERFGKLFRFTPQLLACDLHPDYMSTTTAKDFASKLNLPLITVQHHHAHAVACMLEYGINEPVIAIVWDGTGLGDDGKVWGGEFFVCTRDRYERLSHLDYVPMPGGDKASDEPWRMAVSYMHHYGLELPASFTRRIGKSKIKMLSTLIEKKINTPETSGAGRLFDAFASLLGLCDIATRQAEAPVLLEQCADNEFTDSYPFDTSMPEISSKPIFQGVIRDMENGVSVKSISAKIHNSLSFLILEKARSLRKETGTSKVVISGGCFQNKRLTEHLQRLFAEANIPLFVPSRIPCNDGGVSVGQLATAAAIRKKRLEQGVKD